MSDSRRRSQLPRTRKAARDVREFLAHDPTRLAKQLKAPLRDAAAMNATRWALKAALERAGLPVSTFSGGRTKWNRSKLGVPKTHALDAAVVGPTASLSGWQVPTLDLKATGRGSYCRTRLDRYGFPRGYLMLSKTAFGFATGDHVAADVAIRKTRSFNTTTREGVVQGISHNHCRVLQRGSGYAISQTPKTTEEMRIHSLAEA